MPVARPRLPVWSAAQPSYQLLDEGANANGGAGAAAGGYLAAAPAEAREISGVGGGQGGGWENLSPSRQPGRANYSAGGTNGETSPKKKGVFRRLFGGRD